MNLLANLLHSERHRVRLIIAVSCIAAAASVAWVGAPQTQGSTVSGEVVNGTPGGAVPDDLPVTLHVFSQMEETGTYTTTVTEGGSFRFDGIALNEGDTVAARAVYDGVTYVSEFSTAQEGQQEFSLPITVYEPTQDPSGVAIFQLHLFVNRVGERIQVGTYAVMGNTGSRTYIGSASGDFRTTWSVALPDRATNLQFEGGDLGGRFVSLEDGFADTRPVPPGGAGVETSFTYELPLEEGVEIGQSFDVPVRAAVLVLPEGEWALEGANITSEGTLETQMGPAVSYAAGPLSAGEPLAFAVVPSSSIASEIPGDQSPNELVLGIAALVAAGVVITVMWRSQSPGPVPPKVRPQIETIAALDDDFENGKLPEDEYREKRLALKRQLRHKLSDEHR